MIEPEQEVLPSQNGRSANGRFATGNKLGPGNTSARINIAAIARRKAKELDIDLEDLVWNVVQTMLWMGACGDTKAAKIVHDMLGEHEAKGPLITIDATGRVPEAPPLRFEGVDGAPPLSEHVGRLVDIVKERGLANLLDAHPADIVDTIANRSAEEEFLS